MIFSTAFVLTSILTFGDGQSVLPKQYSSYRPGALCNPSDYMRYPTTISDVVLIVQEAISRNITVKAFGHRHSQTEIICTEGIPVDNRGLQFYQMNSDGTVTFGAGVFLRNATEFLRNHGRALRTTPAFGELTIAGAIGTGAHGSSIKYTSSISEQVVGVVIIDGLGKVQNITDQADLNAFRINLGLLGIVVRVTLITQPLYKTLAHNYVVSDSVLTDGTAQRWAQTADQMSLYWFPSVSQVVVSNWTIVDVKTPGNAYTNDHVPSTYDSFNVLISNMAEQMAILTQNKYSPVRQLAFTVSNVLQAKMQATLFTTTIDFVPIYTEDGTTLLNPAVGYYDKMFAAVCNDGPSGNDPLLQCLWGHGNVHANITTLDNEISVPLSDMPQFIQAMQDIFTKAPVTFPLQGILMRFSANSTTYMSNAYGRDSVGFEWYLAHRKNKYQDATASLAAYQTMMQTLTKGFNGRSHWGKSGMVYHSSPMLDLKLDNTARDKFIAAMNKFDPNGVYMNNFGRRLKNISTTQDIDPANVHCALLDNCFCSQSSDCASYQNCVTLPGYSNYNVCQTIGEQPQTFPSIPTNLLVSLNEWMTSTLNSLPNAVEEVLLNVLDCFPFLGGKCEAGNHLLSPGES